MIRTYYNDDYAGLEIKGIRFYYGYEFPLSVEDDINDVEEDWYFIVRRTGEKEIIFRLSTTQLHEKCDSLDRYSGPEIYLLAGIGCYLTFINEQENLGIS